MTKAAAQADREALAYALLDAWRRLPDQAPAAAECLRRVPEVLGDEGVLWLVPYVFPARAPLSLLGKLRSKKPDTAVSPELQNIARAALDKIVADVEADRLPFLEQQMRVSRYQLRDEWAGIAELKPDDVRALVDDEHRPAQLAVLTMHGDGFVREAALRMLGAGPMDQAFPFVLLRANDWVEPIRRLATERVIAFLQRPGSESIVARALPLIVRFQEYGRGEHDPLRRALRQHLESTDGARTLFRAGGIKARRTVVRFLTLSEPSVRLSFVEEALLDRDAAVRLWGARQLEELERVDAKRAGELSSRLLSDSSAAIRREAIYALVRRHIAGSALELRAALLDPAASIRHAARFYLQETKLDGPESFRIAYRKGLQARGQRRIAAIAGLAETGTKEDAELLEPFLEHASSRVVRATLAARMRLDPESTRSHLLRALVDPRRGVSHQALVLLGRRVWAAGAATLRSLATNAKSAHAADALARAAAKLPLWEALSTLLAFVLQHDERLRASAARELSTWPKLHSSYDAKLRDPALRSEFISQLERAREVLPPEVVTDLEQKIALYLR